MFKSKKKVVYSLMAITILSSSVASAASHRATNYNSRYNSYTRRYGTYYNFNDNNNSYSNKKDTVVNRYPIFNWGTSNNQSNSPNYNWENPNNLNNRPNNSQNSVERPTTPESTPSVSGISSIEMEVIRLVNVERQKASLSPLTASSALSSVARKKSEDMVVNNYFSHTSPTYGSSHNMMKQFGINSSYTGENIAKGQMSAESVVRAWMNSSGHRDNIMNPNFTTIGVGHYKSSNGTNLWTQMFTN